MNSVFSHEKIIIICTLLLLPTTTFAGSNTEQLRQKLDKLLAQRNSLINAKYKDIKRLKKYLTANGNAINHLQTYEQLYEEYYVFQFDSAMTYLDKGIQLSQQIKNSYYYNTNVIRKG